MKIRQEPIFKKCRLADLINWWPTIPNNLPKWLFPFTHLPIFMSVLLNECQMLLSVKMKLEKLQCGKFVSCN